MVYEDDAGSVSEHTFAEFRARSNQLARVFAGLGIERGDRVGIVLPQRPRPRSRIWPRTSSARSHCRSRPCSAPRRSSTLRDAGAKVVVTDADNLERVLAVAKGCPRSRT
jgi:acetyl-CoA synthetase